MVARKVKTAFLLLILCAALTPALVKEAGAQKPPVLKIGVVNFQTVLNKSQAGKRSRKILESAKQQKEAELKAVGDQIKKEREELANNILLTQAAKAKKEKDLRVRENRWRRDFKAAERDLQQKQIKVSETIFTELKTVISLVAKEQDFDFIIEQSNAQTILFSRSKMRNLTKEVIERYDNISE